MSSEPNRRVSHADLTVFVQSVLKAAGVADEEVPILAGSLLWADLAGRTKHGVNRLPTYLERLRTGAIASPSGPSVVTSSGAVTVLDGHRGFGHYVGHIARSEPLRPPSSTRLDSWASRIAIISGWACTSSKWPVGVAWSALP